MAVSNADTAKSIAGWVHLRAQEHEDHKKRGKLAKELMDLMQAWADSADAGTHDAWIKDNRPRVKELMRLLGIDHNDRELYGAELYAKAAEVFKPKEG